MGIRLRIPELLEARKLTAYGLAKASSGRISLSTAYRLVRNRGRAGFFQAGLLEALCDTLKLEPGALFERDSRGRGKPSRR